MIEDRGADVLWLAVAVMMWVLFTVQVGGC
jgi:hypothetical protein